MSRQLPTGIFAGIGDLVRLPYFELREGSIAIADPALGPIVDAHAHLALGYCGRARVDLCGAPGPTLHYLPVARPVDLDVYANKNFTAEDLRRMRWDLTLASFTSRGMRATHTVRNLAREMSALGIAVAVLLPIDYPVLSHNAEAYLAIAARRADFVSLGSVHPYARNLAMALDRQMARGARGIKVHPAVQLVAPDHHRAMRLYRLCAERDLPVFFHCGPVGIEPRLGRYLSQVRRYEPAVSQNPRTTFVLGHSGALQMEEALEIAKRHANVYLDITSQSLPNLRRILAEAPEDRILFGSDWPFYHQAISLAKVLIATEGRPALRAKVLRQNAARLFRIRIDAAAARPVPGQAS